MALLRIWHNPNTGRIEACLEHFIIDLWSYRLATKCHLHISRIPTHAVEKIEKGVFIDFKELFSNNIAPVSQLHQLSHSFSLMQLSGHMKDITDPLSWVYFLLILAASVEDKKTQELMAFFSSCVA